MKRARSSGKSKQPTKKRKTQAQVAQAVVRKELRKTTELKYTDHQLINSGVNSSATIGSLLQNLTRGDAGINSFEGNLLRPQAIRIKYHFNTDQVYSTCRFLVFQWFDNTPPILGTVLANVSTGSAPICDINVNYKRFIKVLHDQTQVISPTASGDATVLGQGITPVTDVYIPGKRIRAVKMNSTTNVIMDGDIYYLIVSDDSLITYPAVSFFSRVSFTDA